MSAITEITDLLIAAGNKALAELAAMGITAIDSNRAHTLQAVAEHVRTALERLREVQDDAPNEPESTTAMPSVGLHPVAQPVFTSEVEQLKTLRFQRGLTLMELAALAGVSHSSISHAENGIGSDAMVRHLLAVLRNPDDPPPPPPPHGRRRRPLEGLLSDTADCPFCAHEVGREVTGTAPCERHASTISEDPLGAMLVQDLREIAARQERGAA